MNNYQFSKVTGDLHPSCLNKIKTQNPYFFYLLPKFNYLAIFEKWYESIPQIRFNFANLFQSLRKYTELMTDDRNFPTEQLAQQLSAIQQQLLELNHRFDRVDHRLEELADVPAKIANLESDLMLLGDRYRYKALQEYLAEENWFEADKETVRLILAVTSREIEELTPEDIQHFPCNDLMVIDRLWRKSSGDRFGFSVQLQIYQAVGGSVDSTIEQNQQLVEAWGKRLGWRKDNRWLKCKDLDFSLNAPVGCHPSRWWNSPYGSKMTNFFLRRLMTCEISVNND